ncbi:hypothetical protein HanIR_Chr07g0323401 [Helianthus annuus]|nr:hypothetical protein HanIR_Chr07g0323401 [Helianthus annuus]
MMLRPKPAQCHLHQDRHHQQAMTRQSPVWVPLLAHHRPIPRQQTVPRTVHHFSARNRSSGRFYKEQTSPAKTISTLS